MIDKVFFFGCWDGNNGHFLYTPDGRTVRDRDAPRPFNKWSMIDGLFVSSVDEQSACVLVHVRGHLEWTIVQCADYSADTRPGSNAAIIAEGTWTFEEMRAQWLHHFRAQFERIEAAAPIRLLRSQP